MTDKEKTIVTAYTGVTMLQGEKLDLLYDYVSKLIGRPVQTLDFVYLADKIQELSKPDFIKLCAEDTERRGGMTEKKLNEISSKVRETVINFLDTDKYALLDLVVSLHNELCHEVEGKYCDYAYHWANLGYGGCPNDSMFKEKGGDTK